MQTAKCEHCGIAAHLGAMFSATVGLKKKLLCSACADTSFASASESEPVEIRAATDPTICALCKAESSATELPRVGSVPVCDTCRTMLYNRPFPQWLKLGFVGLLMLLAVALVNGLPYFHAGRALARGERLLSQKRYGEAAPLLEDAVRVAPSSQKAILLAAKAYLLSGDSDSAWKIADNRSEYDSSELFEEVNAIFRRVDDALKKADEAETLREQRKIKDAIRTMRTAAAGYPEMPVLAEIADSWVRVAAFEDKDYDLFLELNEQRWRKSPHSSTAAASLASALACKYAVTGGASLRTRSYEMLDRAASLAKSADDKRDLKEYEERIRHRLTSRVIIDKQEYERRFRQKPKEGGA